jgi:hypothetical protein
MQVTPTSFTVAEYCQQMQDGKITINRQYQRSDKVWPPAARSYLIDTILLGYPMPKMSLYQKTDLKSRSTIKEIVDGQQRSQAILDFYTGELRLTGKSDYSGSRYQDLDEDFQQTFLQYQLTTDVFVGATDDDIRQVFRRINSYTVPLNEQEKRHATFQGPFKWYIVSLSELYAQLLKDFGVLTEKQINRMGDAALFTEITAALLNGLQTGSAKKMEQIYSDHDDKFLQEAPYKKRFKEAFSELTRWKEIHNTSLMKPYSFYSLLLAVTHFERPVLRLRTVAAPGNGIKNRDIALANLSKLAQAVDSGSTKGPYRDFIEASSAATNTEAHRSIRFKYYCKALRPKLL